MGTFNDLASSIAASHVLARLTEVTGSGLPPAKAFPRKADATIAAHEAARFQRVFMGFCSFVPADECGGGGGALLLEVRLPRSSPSRCDRVAGSAGARAFAGGAQQGTARIRLGTRCG